MGVSTPAALRRAAAMAAAAAALLPVPAHAEAGSPCAGADPGAFPLTTRLHDGPGSYRAGGGHGTWYLDLTNTTGRTCTGLHPVVVLVDAGRALQPTQPHLDFYVGGRPHPVRFETTDEDELVGAFTDGPKGEADAFPGFTVGPRKTLTVKLRLALTSDTAPNDITANAAVVQRHGDDGDWIGQSNDYRFSVEAATDTATDQDADTDTAPDSASEPDLTTTLLPPPPPTPTTATPSSSSSPKPDASPSARATGTPSLADEAKELARSGLTSTPALLAATGCLLAVGAALLLARRRD
ncbi:hypothetical protein ACIBVL_40565 [Streptomyces sp. NPDC049687]|uniref:hypothetical protein n=1 Tax=Streptomyces sp. NPDC049687 TaxID=3365596 RepID=UPI0037ACBFDC